MRSNTIVFIAIRNIGDSNDNGEFFEGQLKEGILWLAACLGNKVMQKRFAIGIGRDKAGAIAAIDLKRSNVHGLAAELDDQLDALLNGESLESLMDATAAEGGTLDTWTGPSA